MSPGVSSSVGSTRCTKEVNGSILQDMQCTSYCSHIMFTFPFRTPNIRENVNQVNRNTKLFEYQLPFDFYRDPRIEYSVFITLEFHDSDIHLISQSLEAALLHDQSPDCGLNNAQLITACDKTGSSSDSCSGNWYEAHSDDVIPVEVTNLAEVYLINDSFHVLPEMILYYVTFDAETDEKVELLMICGSETSRLVPDCVHITLNQSHYERHLDADNETMYIVYGSKAFNRSEFILLPDGRVQLCITDAFSSFFHYTGYLDVVNTISSCISMTALSATFITYCKFKELRNIFGKSLMNLILALFIAQLMPILSKLQVGGGSICVYIAAASHYVWISSFTWMTILAIDLADRFAFRPLKLHGKGSIFGKALMNLIVALVTAQLLPILSNLQVGGICVYVVVTFGSRRLHG